MKTMRLEVLDDHVPLKDSQGKAVFDKEDHPLEMPAFSFRENLLAILGAPMADGLKLQQIRDLDRVFRVVEATEEVGVLELEDADYTVLMEHMARMSYGGYNRYICRMVDVLEAAGKPAEAAAEVALPD